MDSVTNGLHLLALPAELRCRIWTILFGYQSARLVQKSNGAEYLLGEPRSSQILRVCKQAHAEACPILYANTWFKCSFSSDPREIWRAVGLDNGGMIKWVEMHVDNYEDCVLYHCKPHYTPDLELVKIQIASRRWLSIDLDAHERRERLQALFTTRLLKGPMSKSCPSVVEQHHRVGEVHFEICLSDPEVSTTKELVSANGSREAGEGTAAED